MSVSSTLRKQQFPLDGATADYTFNFRALTSAPEDIKCYVTTNGTDTVLVYTTNYSVEINSDGIGGTVTLVSASTIGLGTLTVYRDTTLAQESDYDDYNQFPANTLEENLDQLMVIAQEHAEELDRAIKLPITYAITSSTGFLLPLPVAGKALKWNASADSLLNTDVDIDTAIAAALASQVAAATSATTATNQAVAAAASAAAAIANAGINANGYASINAAVAAIGSTQSTLVVSDAQTLTASLTIPSTCTLKILQGGSIVKASSYTLTINGSFEAGLYQVFSGFTTAGDITFGLGSIDYVLPEWFGAKGDATTNDYTAINTMVTAIPSYSTVKLSGIYSLGTTLAINKILNLSGVGINSGFYLTMGVASDGITFGNTESGSSVIKHATWKDFGIYGAASACKNALVLTGMLQNVFDNIHVMAGTAATGYGVWARWCQSNHRINFIMGQFYAQYPVSCATPSNGFKSSSSTDTDTVFNDNVLDVIVEGMAGKGIYLYGGISSKITGLSEGNTDYSLHLKSCNYFHITDFYSETASATANENEIYIEGGSSNILGSGVFSIPGAPGNTDVKISGATDTKIDGLFCSILSIDATSVDTKIGQITTTGQSGSGILDLGINTSQINANTTGYNGSNNAGLFSDFNSIIFNGSLERWIDVNTPAGSTWSFLSATATRETSIVQHGISSCKVEITGGTINKRAKLDIPVALFTQNPRGRMTVTGWIYIPTATGTDIHAYIYRGGNPYTGVVITTRDAWTRVSISIDNTLGGTLTSADLRFYNSAASNTTFYLDGWSVVPGVAGGASLFTPNANEFPKYTGSATWNPGSLAPGIQESMDFTVLGAALGMCAIAGAGVSTVDLQVSATVTAADTVTVVIKNGTSGTVDLASSTWKILVIDIS